MTVVISEFTSGLVCPLLLENELGIPDGNFVKEFLTGIRRLEHFCRAMLFTDGLKRSLKPLFSIFHVL